MRRRFADEEILRHSGVMLAVTILSKVLSYIFYFIMARLLIPEDYGTLGALLSFFFVANVFIGGIQPIIANFTAEFQRKNEKGKIKTLLIVASKKLGLYGVLGFTLISIFSPLISAFLHMPSNVPVIIIGITFALGAVLMVIRGILQGLGNFLSLGINLSLETALRVLFGALLVFFGLGINGAVLAIALAVLVSIFSGVLPLRFILRESREKINASEIYAYSLPVILTSFATVAMVNIDVILVKHYFDAATAGYYAAASLLAKVPLILLRESMGPVVFTHAAKGELKVLRTSLKYTVSILLPLLSIYWFIPEIIVKILYGPAYSQATNYMKFLAFPMALMGINMIAINYLLARRKTSFVKYLLIVLLLQAVLISYFHTKIYNIIGTVAMVYSILAIIIFFHLLKMKNST